MSVQAKAATRVDWRRHALRMLALWAFALLAYSNSFRAGFVFDNDRAILRDSRVHAATSENLHLILNEEYWYKTTATLLYRPLTTFSYLLDYAIFGNGPHPAGYHWVNFALHALNIALVYLLGLLLFQETRLKEHLALALAAVWGLHPILTESVTNIVGRADLLAGCGGTGFVEQVGNLRRVGNPMPLSNWREWRSRRRRCHASRSRKGSCLPNCYCAGPGGRAWNRVRWDEKRGQSHGV